jgi:hypothetical protein
MIMAEGIRARGQRRDRWVSWIVVAIFVVALILGWVVKAMAEGRTSLYNEGGIQVSYPQGWVKDTAAAVAPVLLQVEDKLNGTSLALQKRASPTGMTQPLGKIATDMSLERSRWTSYRELDREMSKPEDVIWIGGREAAMHVTFAYVEANPNFARQNVPTVMLGDDYFFPVGNDVYIVTFTAAEANYAQARGYLETFVRTLQVP